MLVGGAAGARSTEHDRGNAVELRNARDNLAQYFFDLLGTSHAASVGRASNAGNEMNSGIDRNCAANSRCTCGAKQRLQSRDALV